VVILIVVFAGPVAGRRGGQGGMRTALAMIVIALVLGAILACVRQLQPRSAEELSMDTSGRSVHPEKSNRRSFDFVPLMRDFAQDDGRVY
jgi:hypothetical protein